MFHTPESIKAESGYRRQKASESGSRARRTDTSSRTVVRGKRRNPILKARRAWSL
jgi:hypothetical protein